MSPSERRRKIALGIILNKLRTPGKVVTLQQSVSLLSPETLLEIFQLADAAYHGKPFDRLDAVVKQIGNLQDDT